MADHSAIQWTDATWNPTTGCTKISPGCAHCYIERTPAFRIAGRQFVNGAIDLRLYTDRLEQPLRWKKPRRVFVNSLSDLFHEDVPDAFIDQVFAVMALSRRHTFQILTKRAPRMLAYMASAGLAQRVAVEMCHTPGWDRVPAIDDFANVTWRMDASERPIPAGLVTWPLLNVWLGVSVENQRFADERIPLLLQTPAAVRFISAEPLLGPVDFSGSCLEWLAPFKDTDASLNRSPRLDWVIVGGESGPGARPFDVGWARSIVRQCQSADVPVFVKQLGAHVLDRNDAGFEGDTATSWPMDTDTLDIGCGHHQGDPVRVRLKKKAGEPSEWPADLRVREFPEARV